MGTLATTLAGEVACNDDFCENTSTLYLSLIEGVVINANTPNTTNKIFKILRKNK